MHLLRKNLILASLASVAMVGLLGSSSASALDGFSVIDLINEHPELSVLSKPFGSLSNACESTNPDSTISCNETPSFPSLLFNQATIGPSLWSHDGKGVVFTDTENLIDNNPQEKTAKPGDRLNYSIKMDTVRYLDDEKSEPIEEYNFGAILSSGLDLDRSSVVLRIDGEPVNLENNQHIYSNYEEYPANELKDIEAMLGERTNIARILSFAIDWRDYDSGIFIYEDGATIELTFSAIVSETAAGKLFSRGIYNTQSESGLGIASYTSELDALKDQDWQADAYVSDAIIIRRVDENGNPIAGAKYVVDGVKAKQGKKYYEYDESGTISVFETDEKGEAVIANVPVGKYTVREQSAPSGVKPSPEIITKTVLKGAEIIEFGYDLTFKSPFSSDSKTVNITDKIAKLDDGKEIVYGAADVFYGASSTIYTYDEAIDGYTYGGLYTIKETAEGYRLTLDVSATIRYEVDFHYDESLKKYIAPISYYAFIAALNPNTDLSDMTGISINGNQASLPALINGRAITMSYNQETDCFAGADDSTSMILCEGKNGDYWLEETPGNYGTFGRHYIYDKNQNKLVLEDYVLSYYVLEDIAEDKLTVSNASSLSYSPRFDHYYMTYSIYGPTLLSNATRSIPATEFLFNGIIEEGESGEEADGVVPESIPNPQTSDAVLKAIIIAGIGLAPTFVLRKQLAKRP